MNLRPWRKAPPPPPTADNFRGHVIVNGQTITIPDFGSSGAAPWTSHTAKRPKIAGAGAAMEYGNAHDVVSAAVTARADLLAQLWPVFRDLRTRNIIEGGRDLRWFNDRQMMLNLLLRMEPHGSYTGNAYIYRNDKLGRLQLLNPANVEIMLDTDASPTEVAELEESGVPVMEALDAQVVGYVHAPPGRRADIIPPSSVGHWMPERHPTTDWIGASWVTAVVDRIAADEQADIAADKFFEHGSTGRLVYIMDKAATPDEVQKFKDINEAAQAGVINFHRNGYLGGGHDVKVVGASLKELSLKEYRGVLENRIAVRSRVPANILGISEGLQGSTLNAGNYDSVRRMWSDGFVQTHLDTAAAALGTLVEGPSKDGIGSYLSWDPRHVLFMQADEKDAAEIRQKNAITIRQYTDAGFTPQSAVAAVENDDLTLLEHTNLFSVQLQPAGTTNQPEGGDQ